LDFVNHAQLESKSLVFYLARVIMLAPLFNVKAIVSCAAAQPRGGLRSGLVGLFIFACLVLPGLIWRHSAQETKSVIWATDSWLEFFPPEFAILAFAPAPSLDLHLGLVDPWPDEAEAGTVPMAFGDAQAWSWLPAEVERGYWMEGRFSPAWRTTDVGQFNYKVTPSFNFQQQGLKPSGVVIRLWINF